MNNYRVLRACNILLLFTGYQLHWFDSKLQRYRVSLPGALNIFILACFYAGCFAQHFEPAALLKTLQDVSPFLYGLTRMQLLLTVKVFSYAVYASVRAVGVANTLTESLPLRSSRACSKEEVFAYGFLFSTFLVLLVFGVYIGYEMEFKLPPLQDAMIGFALFLPHLILAGALRLYCTFAWITRDRLRQLQAEVEQLLDDSKIKTEMEQVATGSVAVPVLIATPTTTDNLLSHSQQLQQLVARFGALFASLQRSLLLLLGVNGNCLLFGVYSYVFYSSTWHVLFGDRKRRIFYAGNASIYACIACDYACLLLSQTFLEQQRFQFLEKLNSALSPKDVLSKRMRSIVKDMRSTLTNNLQLKFLSVWRFNVPNFILLQVIQFLIIALIVVYYYLNDAILQINEQLDSINDE